jgi:beta-glucosidase
MFSQQVVAGASLLASTALLSGCGGDTTTTKAPAPSPAPGPSPSDGYNETVLIEAFGHNPSFLWGGATAAAQIEGAWDTGGKQPSIWDDFCHSIRTPPSHPDTTNGSTPATTFNKQCGKYPESVTSPAEIARWTTLEVTDDFYHKYESDLDLLSSYNFNAMRISLSWPRLMPYNATTGQHERSQDGVDFYKAVFAKMKQNEITPVVTLFHWDLPNDLTFLNESVVEEFAKYAKLAFDEFHSDVSDWATFNEPTSSCSLGYSIGAFAPGHKSTTDHLVCGKNLLLSHARAYHMYRDGVNAGTYNCPGQACQIGIVLDYKWTYPDDPSNQQDKTLAQWDRDNVIGFWADPIFGTGDFPESLKTFYGDKMPVLSAANQTALRGSADFWGANTYGGKITKASAYSKPLSEYSPGDDMAERYSFCPCNPDENTSHVTDMAFECGAASGWLWAKPDAMYQYLNYIKTHYNNAKIYVTEFGCDVEGESDMPKAQALQDDFRKTYYQLYMMQVAKAKNEGADVKGVFAWSLMDNFEWGDGLNFRFGITYVDFEDTDLPRTPKASGTWWQGLIANMSSSPAPAPSVVSV